MRISQKQLEEAIKLLNEETNSPIKYCNEETGKCNVDNFHLCIACGGYSLARITGANGRADFILYRTTRKELYDQIQALRVGIQFGRTLK